MGYLFGPVIRSQSYERLMLERRNQTVDLPQITGQCPDVRGHPEGDRRHDRTHLLDVIPALEEGVDERNREDER